MPSEFDLIRRHFDRPARHCELAVGDDAALVSVADGMQLAVSTDMLVAGTHFLADTDPCDLGWKTLAVNVSDLAAMAARPRWAVLALALPLADDAWVGAFAHGLFACAQAFGIDLVGGDTTRGPLTLALSLFGEVAPGCAIRRDGARPGDDLWISGQPGLAALGLAALQGRIELPEAGRAQALSALQRPQPRLALGLALQGIASAMLDVSDGLLGDLGHILERSACGAIVEVGALPLQALVDAGASPAWARHCVLGGGDDYELLFSAPRPARAQVHALAARLELPLHRIGTLCAAADGLRLRERDGTLAAGERTGYDHFR